MTDILETRPIPVVPLRGGSVFPGVTTTVSIGRRTSLAAVQAAIERGGDLLVVVQKDAQVEEPSTEDVFPIAILATARDMIRTPMGVQMVVELDHRVRLLGLEPLENYSVGRYEELAETDQADEALQLETIAYLEQYIDLVGESNQQVMTAIRDRETAGQLADFVAGLLNLPFELEVTLLNELDGQTRLGHILEHLQQELRIAEIRSKIQQEAQDGAEKAQRDYMLREQMKAIRKELGEEADESGDDLRQKIENAGMPEKVLERALSELKRLDYQGPQSAEASVIRTYL
ncbi:MAG: LON peptidase substrate-binding domain-containing protein [Chloroflexota bacterium]